MSDCIVKSITDNIVTTLTAKSFTIGTTAYASLAEQQRSVYNNRNTELYIEVCGPWPITLKESNKAKHVQLDYVIECHINFINDDPPNDPITKQIANIGADISTLLFSDISRGSKAIMTRVDGEPYYYFTNAETQPETIVRIDVQVEAFLAWNNPFSQGA